MARFARGVLIVFGALSLAGELLAQPAPLHPSVILFDEATLRRAPALVDRAARLGHRRVQVVVKLHCRLTPELKITEYGLLGDRRLQWKAPLHPGNFLPLDENHRRAFVVGLAAVFRRAAERGLDLAVLPHLDAYGRVAEWRNHFDFDPLERHAGPGLEGHSYASALVTPIVDALIAARGAAPGGRGTDVQFSLAGEMGRSLFRHAAFYDEIGQHVRRRLGPGRVAIGVSLNHNDVAGGHEPTPAQLAALQRLINRCDFVGFSHYRPFEPPPRVEHFVEACEAFERALAKHGIKVPEKTPLHFSEVGLGGNPDAEGATTPARAAAKPWEGTNDSRRDPWRTDEMKAFRRAYHDALLKFLVTQPARHRVAAAYLWSEGSWDPQGVGGQWFADEGIVEMIRQHEQKIKASGRR